MIDRQIEQIKSVYLITQNMSHSSQHPMQHNLLSKTTSPRSCQSLICLARRCREQEQKKQKQKMLNSSYFQKLSLKKFNMNSSTFCNQSFYDKNPNDKTIIKKERSTSDSDFQNVQLKRLDGKQSQSIICQQHNSNINHRTITTYSQYENQRSTQRIIRSSSSTQLSNHQQPQLNQPTTIIESSMQRQITIDLQKLQHLSKLRCTLQKEIEQLDSNIDKYYHVYQAKLKELGRIKNKLKEVEVEGQEQKKAMEQTTPGDRMECGLFRKKGYVGENMPRGNNHQILAVGRQQKIPQQIHSTNNKLNNHGLQVVNQSPKYCHNTNIIFNKKLN